MSPAWRASQGPVTTETPPVCGAAAAGAATRPGGSPATGSARPRGGWVLLGLCGAVALGAACGSAPRQAAAPAASGRARSATSGVVDESRCDYKGRADREVVEGRGPGAEQPSIRKVYGQLGTQDDARKVLLCREVDTNLDGQMDVVRVYNDRGDVISEQADADYDGRVDTWIVFARGRVSKVQTDGNRDGKPDETRWYIDGRLSRLQRDTNHDDRPDAWEIYHEGALERMGVDLDFDGRVDRWDRDLVTQRQLEERERREQDEAARAAASASASAAPPLRAPPSASGVRGGGAAPAAGSAPTPTSSGAPASGASAVPGASAGPMPSASAPGQ